MLPGNTDEYWIKFRERIELLEETCVPTKKVKDSKYKKAPWLTYKAVKLVKRKHGLFAR